LDDTGPNNVKQKMMNSNSDINNAPSAESSSSGSPFAPNLRGEDSFHNDTAPSDQEHSNFEDLAMDAALGGDLSEYFYLELSS
jgi:hypothetical protein